ncbi:hypothetical protein GLX27_004426 [Malassezia furfur]|uniref:Uncharacterized protein n=1 Tax=Malassezia furfur TaxID=55194 RepID=A0ABY8EVV1_MALFU|nr:hypothetical protein GLX27_004426 [Malassezia furfur]
MTAQPVLHTACPPAHHFWRCAQWSPDGTLLLARAESHTLHIFFVAKERLELLRTYRSPTPVLDTQWYMYPAASDDDEVHWCFAVSSRDVPMRLVDARTGTTKATFAMVNHIEEYIAPTSLAFSKDGARLFGGLTSAVALCPLATPGANRHSVLDLAPSQDSAGAGQSGIISALAPGWAPRVFDEENEGRPLEILAVGTFGGTIGLYVTDAHWLANAADVLYNEYGNPPRHGASEVVPGHRVCLAGWRLAEGKGITQLAWHPTQRNILVVAARRSSFLYVYDTGYLYGTSTPFSFERRSTEDPALLAKLPRPAVDTHQRFWFDLDEHGDYIVTGDECGTIPLVPPSLEWHAHAV